MSEDDKPKRGRPPGPARGTYTVTPGNIVTDAKGVKYFGGDEIALTEEQAESLGPRVE